jgi:hypothetical protein
VRAAAALLALLVLPGLSACGSGGSGGSGSPASGAAPAASGTTGGAPPAELVGTYQTTLDPGDIPASKPQELQDGGLVWTLEISETGGPDGGPSLAISSPAVGNLEAPSLRVDGDRLLLEHEICAAGGSQKFYDNEYSWVLEDTVLTLTTVKNQCADQVAETVLTSKPWTKTN